MPYYLMVGIPEERILEGTPNDLKPFIDAFNLKVKMQDQQSWMHNMYTMGAVFVAIDKAINGKKAKSKYFDEPMLSKTNEEKKELTEDEIKDQREQLLSKLKIMQKNFEMNHKKKAGD